jgi:nicotinamidase-related amidase
VPGKENEPFISKHLKNLRPFLKKGDFAPASWGNSLVESLQPADITVEKVAYSAFYQTRMEYSLYKAGIKTLFVCGIVTNGGVASTVRDAHVRDFHTITLEDGCAAWSVETHELAINSLRSVGEVMTISEAISLINGN